MIVGEDIGPVTLADNVFAYFAVLAGQLLFATFFGIMSVNETYIFALDRLLKYCHCLFPFTQDKPGSQLK